MSDLDHQEVAADGVRRRRGLLETIAGPQRFVHRLEALRFAVAATFEREMEAGRGFIWLPVLFGIGVAIYFALPAEPSAIGLLVGAIGLGVVAWRGRRRVVAFRILIALTAVSAGVCVTKLRTDAVTAPVLARETTVNVTGWVAAREAATRGGVRVVLWVEAMDRVPTANRPKKVRITIRSKADAIAVGDGISTLARLRPPSGPAYPGGYDFGRADFYRGIGAVGFSYGAARPADIGPAPFAVRAAMPVAHLRQTIRERILAALPGENGQIAAALVMGDRRGIPEATQEAMRASGLGHVLAISGLHMALVAGSAFWLIRALLALSQTLAINWPIRKWAAGGALAIAAFYLAISGGSVSTQRAFIMLAVMLVAILIDRRALTLRNVAIAAAIVLVIEPESLLTASFQMSFAATVALVAGYEFLRERADRAAALADASDPGVLGRLWFSTRGLLLTSLIAGAATTPFAVYHFQRGAPLTLVANLLAMPVVGLVVMPMAFFAVVLMPVGLESLPLTVMSWGLDWVLFVARTVAGRSEGWGGVPAAPVAALVLVVIGFLWLCLWHERWRVLGVLPMVAALPVVLLAPRPDILIGAGGQVAAVRGQDGRYVVIGAKNNRFIVDMWLRADADGRTAKDNVDAGVRCDAIGCVVSLPDGSLLAMGSERTAFTEDCHLAAVVVSRFPAPAQCTDTGYVIDRYALDRGGSHAFYRIEGKGNDHPVFHVETAYPENRRPFMPPLE